MKKVINFFPDNDSFGCNNVKSLIFNLEYYLCVNQILDDRPWINFNFSNEINESSIFVIDVFELYKQSNIVFQDLNIIVVETLRQLIDLVNLNKFDLSKKYIVFSESWWDEKEYQWSNLNYTLLYISWEIIDVKHRISNSNNLYHYLLDLDTIEKYQPKFDFLCLAGRGKEWRDLFIQKLKTTIDLSNSLTSYCGQSLGHNDLLKLDISYSRDKQRFDKEFYSPTGETKHQYVLSYFTKPELFYQTKFSVVVETEAKHKEYHVTEKTLKCLATGHPFVVMGTYHYLDFLKKLGFVTYNHLFSEEYDNILDLEERMDAVINVVKHLQQNFTFQKSDLLEIHQHNIKNLFRLKNNDTYEKFLRVIAE